MKYLKINSYFIVIICIFKMVVYILYGSIYLDRVMALWTPLIIAQNPGRPGPRVDRHWTVS